MTHKVGMSQISHNVRLDAKKEMEIENEIDSGDEGPLGKRKICAHRVWL